MTRLQRRPLLGFLADPFSKSARAIEIDGDHLRITRRGQIASMSLELLSSPPSVRKGLLGTALAISVGEQEDVILKGTGYRDAKAFSEELKKAWVRFNLSALENEAARLEKILDGVRALVAPRRYPAACQIAPLLEDACALDASLLSKLQPEAIGAETNERISAVRKFVSDPRAERADGIAAFVTAELDRWKEFFDTIESKPLTAEQRLSVVVDEDATLVLAGAGSGKTSVITAKAAYLVKAGIRQPEEILLLAFAKNGLEAPGPRRA